MYPLPCDYNTSLNNYSTRSVAPQGEHNNAAVTRNIQRGATTIFGRIPKEEAERLRRYILSCNQHQTTLSLHKKKAKGAQSQGSSGGGKTKTALRSLLPSPHSYTRAQRLTREDGTASPGEVKDETEEMRDER